jgi:hypothetical protein
MSSPVQQFLNSDVLALLAKIEREQEHTRRLPRKQQPETDESPSPVYRPESARTRRLFLLALIWTALVALAVAGIVAWRSLNTLISLPVL